MCCLTEVLIIQRGSNFNVCLSNVVMGSRQGALAILREFSNISRSVNPCVHTFTYTYYLLLSMTKFSIVVGSLRAYLSRNRGAITWVSNRGIQFERYPRDLQVNYARFNGVAVCYSFQNFEKGCKSVRSKENLCLIRLPQTITSDIVVRVSRRI